MFTFTKPYFDFYKSLFKVNFQRNKRVALFVDFSDKFPYFALMQKQPPVAPTVLNVKRAAAVLNRDVHTFNNHFGVIHRTIGVL